jgi:AraC-like DNA-binding protein
LIREYLENPLLALIVTRRDQTILTGAEHQALAVIRDIRSQIAAGKISEKLNTPARLAHHVITLYHGHAQLRMSRITSELGVSMRTLQRSFRQVFRTSMKSYQIDRRLRFAQYLLSIDPELKMSVIAKHLGYDDPNVFERFFRNHADTSPHAWSAADQARRLQRGNGSGDSND